MPPSPCLCCLRTQSMLPKPALACRSSVFPAPGSAFPGKHRALPPHASRPAAKRDCSTLRASSGGRAGTPSCVKYRLPHRARSLLHAGKRALPDESRASQLPQAVCRKRRPAAKSLCRPCFMPVPPSFCTGPGNSFFLYGCFTSEKTALSPLMQFFFSSLFPSISAVQHGFVTASS